MALTQGMIDKNVTKSNENGTEIPKTGQTKIQRKHRKRKFSFSIRIGRNCRLI